MKSFKEIMGTLSNSSVELDEATAQDWELKKIHKEYTGLKAKSTSDILKIHQGLRRVTAKYTAGEMGGKQGLIDGIMHHRHGQSRMDVYHSMKPSDRKKLDESIELDESKEHIENHLADKDINSKVEGKTVKVHSSDVASAKKHLAKIGYKDHKVVGGLNEDVELDESRGHKILARTMNRIATRQAVASGEIQPGPKPNETPEEKAKREAGLKNQQKSKTVDEENELDEMAGANMSAKDLHKHLKNKGWTLTRTQGSHDVFTHPKSSKNIAVPRHKGDLKVPTVLQILKTSKIQEDTNMIGYKEFTEMIEEGKMDDLKDRLAATREKRLNDYDFSKEKDKPKSNVTKHFAKDSGEESEPEEKRGRGRPVGSKSGARR